MENAPGKKVKLFLERLIGFAVNNGVIGPNMFNAYYMAESLKKKAAAAAAAKGTADSALSKPPKRANNSSISINSNSGNLKRRKSSSLKIFDDLLE